MKCKPEPKELEHGARVIADWTLGHAPILLISKPDRIVASAKDNIVTLNRSAIVVKPKQPFLDWLHAADPTSFHLTLRELTREPAVYLIPECDTEEDVADVLRELCEEVFVEHSMLIDLCEEPLIRERD